MSPRKRHDRAPSRPALRAVRRCVHDPRATSAPRLPTAAVAEESAGRARSGSGRCPARPGVMAEAACAFSSFCLLSSAAYLVDDVRDREQDRHRPRRRFRPIAAGELSPCGALRLSDHHRRSWTGADGRRRAADARTGARSVSSTLTTSSSICSRHVVVADVVAVADVVVVGAIGGGVARGVALSYSFLIVASTCSL